MKEKFLQEDKNVLHEGPDHFLKRYNKADSPEKWPGKLLAGI